jgi:hypothetical protein
MDVVPSKYLHMKVRSVFLLAVNANLLLKMSSFFTDITAILKCNQAFALKLGSTVFQVFLNIFVARFYLIHPRACSLFVCTLQTGNDLVMDWPRDGLTTWWIDHVMDWPRDGLTAWWIDHVTPAMLDGRTISFLWGMKLFSLSNMPPSRAIQHWLPSHNHAKHLQTPAFTSDIETLVYHIMGYIQYKQNHELYAVSVL